MLSKLLSEMPLRACALALLVSQAMSFELPDRDGLIAYVLKNSPGLTEEQVTKMVDESPALMLAEAKSDGFREVKTTIGALSGYGCWCRPALEADQAFGVPIDPVDALCRDYALNQRCIAMDYPSCDIANNDWTAHFDAFADFSTFPPRLAMVCLEEPKRPIQDKVCGYAYCLVELQAITDQSRELFNSPIDNKNKISNGFNPHEECTPPDTGFNDDVGNNRLNKICCGTYPNRKEFDHRLGKECCTFSGIVFNSILYECCDDGTVSASCQ